MIFQNLYLDHGLKVLGTFDDTFLAVLLNLHSICQKDSLGKIFFCWNCIRFCNKLWTMSKYKWPLGVTNLCFLYFWRKIWSSWKKFDGSAELNSIRPRDRYDKIFGFGAVNFLIDLVYLAESSALLLKLQSRCREKLSGEKDSFREKRSFCHHFCSSANNFATWLVENGGFIKSDFFFPVVSLEKFFIF